MIAPPVNIIRRDEHRIQEQIIAYLRNLEWIVKVAHGNKFQSGFPDLYTSHRRFGQRWVEVKNPVQFSFTPAQLIDFPMMISNGSPIWVMTEACDLEYQKLFKPCNVFEYLQCYSDGCHNIDAWRQGRRK